MLAIPFWKLFTGYPGFYILNIRFLSSSLFMLAFLALRGELGDFFRLFRSRKNLLLFLASGLALYGNWLCNTVAPMIDQVVELSIGQYLSPLLLIFLGSLFFRERLRPLQWVSSLLAISGLAVILTAYGSISWITLLVSTTFFALTALLKGSSVSAIHMTAAQLLVLDPLALCLVLRYETAGQGFYGAGAARWLWPAAIACVSVVPILLFNGAVKKLPSVTLGFFQYLGPTLSMVMGVFVYREALDGSKLLALGLIWLGIALYVSSQVFGGKKSAPSGDGA